MQDFYKRIIQLKQFQANEEDNKTKICKYLSLILNNQNFHQYGIENSSDEKSVSSITSQFDEPEVITADQTFSYEKLVFKLDLNQSGGYFIQAEYFDDLTEQLLVTGPQYFIVDPVFEIYRDDQFLTINTRQMSVLTVLSRSLGTIDQWDNFLITQRVLGYNTIHFTPIQQYGVSQSLYSIKNHNLIDEIYFKEQEPDFEIKVPYKKSRYYEKIRYLKEKIKSIKQEQGWIFIVDLVLNHAARNSDWVSEHPEVTYNLSNCPWLNAAHELDKAILQFSNDYANCKISSCVRAPYLENENDLSQLLKALKIEVIDKLYMHEYFQINVAEYVKKLEQFMKDPFNIDPKSPSNQALRQIIRQNLNYKTSELDLLLRNMTGQGERRYGVHCDIELAASMIIDETLKKPKKQVLEEFATMLNAINSGWEQKIQQYMEEVIKNIEQDLTDRVTLVTPYFSTLINDEKTRALNAGYIPNQNPFEEYGGKDGWHHLRRAAISWGDSIKLKYGPNRASSPFLWDFMAEYVRSMAEIFDGVRLDNAHNTPLQVATYMINEARSVNSNLFVCAELFCDSKQSEIKYVQQLGINHLLRELHHHNVLEYMGHDYFYQTTEQQRLKLNPRDIMPLVFDCNHDSPSYIDKYNKQPSVMLSAILINGLSGNSIASTYGFDILVPKQLSVVSEKRLYPIIDVRQQLKESQAIKNAKTSLRQKINNKYMVHFFYKQKSKKEQIVELAMNSTQWKPIFQLKQVDGVFTLDLELSPGRYEYKYVINGGQYWACEPSQLMIENGFGDRNNYVDVQTRINIEDEIPDVINDNLAFVRNLMNRIHEECNQDDSSVFVEHQRQDNIFTVTREFNNSRSKLFRQKSYDGYFLISKCEFPYDNQAYSETAYITLPGTLVDIEFCGYLEVNLENQYYNYDPKIVNGMKDSKLNIYLKQLPSFIMVEENPFQKGKQQIKIISYQSIPANFNLLVKYLRYDNDPQLSDQEKEF